MRKGSLLRESALDAGGLSFAVVAARWNGEVTERLLEGAVGTLKRAGARKKDVTVLRVPGSFELVSACRRALRLKPSAIVTLGCLIRGETPHFEVLAHSLAAGLASLNASQDVPIAFGVLTCETRKQALERAGGRAGHAGVEAAQAAIEMARLMEAV
jgi:6,7-dimethyl-8-ribityllumazine synthase